MQESSHRDHVLAVAVEPAWLLAEAPIEVLIANEHDATLDDRSSIRSKRPASPPKNASPMKSSRSQSEMLDAFRALREKRSQASEAETVLNAIVASSDVKSLQADLQRITL